jgi:hypothetical protein
VAENMATAVSVCFPFSAPEIAVFTRLAVQSFAQASYILTAGFSAINQITQAAIAIICDMTCFQGRRTSMTVDQGVGPRLAVGLFAPNDKEFDPEMLP